ncbi:glycoside hydrolase family 3 protein [Tolumonas osonensis]|uniref:beta-glucosidase n=1 Tax=Tolumonas osonensis TaxID=675874 RepID=A0A841GA45_9GAMM|nr:glycoside hydrolase family 3 N-terminal domain-containing protein [Tolumonas osonensis]MBB6056004.1 beta-glucosidase [Tolumonas osonensis]
MKFCKTESAANRQAVNLPLKLLSWLISSSLMGGSLMLAADAAEVKQDVLIAKQPVLSARVKNILSLDGQQFKDLNNNGLLDTYEDWQRPVSQRVDDLVSKMTLEEKAGLMLIDTLNADCGGTASQTAVDYINQQRMNRFILRNVVKADPVCGGEIGWGGDPVTPQQMATFTNTIQELSEATRLGIPALFKSNARNHYEKDARVGINEAAGAFTEFPKEAGLAAAALGENNMSVIEDFAKVMGDEWKAIGLRGMYGYMADLSTEPRWYRVHETFTEDADLNADIMKTLVKTLQGGSLNPDSAVALTMKHFPGGGPQEMGLDPHYSHGKNQVYPAGNFAYHLKPFMAAIDAGVSSVMPYYGVPINVTYEGVKYEQVGMAFSKQIVTDLLRGKLGFKGYVNSDTGIINDRGWGLENKTVPERVAAAINGGTDTLSGFHDKQTIIDLVKAGLVTEERVTLAAKRLLQAQFELGLFENPYVDASKAAATIGNDAHRAIGMDIQRKSVVLLQNKDNVLPLKAGASVYAMGIAKSDVEKYGYVVTDGAADKASRPSAAGHDYAVIRVEVTTDKTVTGAFESNNPASGLDKKHINPLTGKTWGSQDRCVLDSKQKCLDDKLKFGGALPWEANNLSFTTMAASKSWKISPSLETIQAIMKEVGAEKTVLSVYFRQPYVLDEQSGLKDAGAIVAGFGVSNTALLDVLSGKFNPQGKMPFALANNLQAVIDNQPDMPGYPAKDTLYPYGFGLSYK